MSKAPTTTPEDVKKLRDTVKFMDCMSQSGFSEIAAIAKLALLSLESPEGHRHLDEIAHALTAIWGKAGEVQNSINYEAEQVGCNDVDEAQRRRWDALRAFRAREDAHA